MRRNRGHAGAIIDGEIVVLNDAGLSDYAALRKAITRPFYRRDVCGYGGLCLQTLQSPGPQADGEPSDMAERWALS